MRFLTYLVLVCFFILPECSLQAGGQKKSTHPGGILQNGDFELPVNSGWGTGQYSAGRKAWWNAGGCRSTATVVSDKAKSGRCSLMLSNQSGLKPNVYGTMNQAIPVVPHQKYRVTLWACAAGLSEGSVSVVVNEQWTLRPLVLPGGTYPWREFAGEFSLPVSVAQFRILMENSGTAWIDDIRVIPLTSQASAGTPRDILSDGQKHILRELGEPDGYNLIFSDKGRVETWFFHRLQTSFFFINGKFQYERMDLQKIENPRMKYPALSPAAIHPGLSRKELEDLVGSRPKEMIEVNLQDVPVQIYLFPYGFSAAYKKGGRLVNFLAYPYQ